MAAQIQPATVAKEVEEAMQINPPQDLSVPATSTPTPAIITRGAKVVASPHISPILLRSEVRNQPQVQSTNRATAGYSPLHSILMRNSLRGQPSATIPRQTTTCMLVRSFKCYHYPLQFPDGKTFWHCRLLNEMHVEPPVLPPFGWQPQRPVKTLPPRGRASLRGHSPARGRPAAARGGLTSASSGIRSSAPIFSRGGSHGRPRGRGANRGRGQPPVSHVRQLHFPSPPRPLPKQVQRLRSLPIQVQRLQPPNQEPRLLPAATPLLPRPGESGTWIRKNGLPWRYVSKALTPATATTTTAPANKEDTDGIIWV